ncbi:MAG: hypothetical protein WAT19_02750 [Ferruginibacter sp.]
MKYLILSTLILAVACNSRTDEPALDGVFTTAYENEFSKGDDTLIVKKANTGEGIYQIERRIGVAKMLDGKEFPKEVISETWTLEYDPNKQTLFDLKKGKTVIWNSGKLTLQLGNREYKKVGK